MVTIAAGDGGRKGTLCLTVDNLGDALTVGRGRAARPDPHETSLEVGVPAFLNLFADLQLQTTYFVEGWNALHHCGVIETIADAGHEIGLHGWLHENWAIDLDDRAREQLLWDGTAALRLAGFDPRAFRAPGGYRGSHTLQVLEDLGYQIDSSIEPGEGSHSETLDVTFPSKAILSIPWTFDMVDYWHYVLAPEESRDPEAIADYWTARVAAAAEHGELLTMIIHPFVCGVDPDRMSALRRVLERAISNPDIDVVSAGQVAARYAR